jgi:ribosomal protein S27E
VADTTALEKYPCPGCGAQATWDPGTRTLRCAFCGAVAAEAPDRGARGVGESDLRRALAELPDAARSGPRDRQSVRCSSCNAVQVFEAHHAGLNCAFCGSAALLDPTAAPAPVRPWGILPFTVPEAAVRSAIRGWLRSKWLAPADLKRRATVDRVSGAYIPYWTFDARVRCPWEAEAGHAHWVDAMHRGADGRLRTRRVRAVRWEPARGVVDHRFDDEPVPGTLGIDTALLAGIEPFPAAELVPYDTAFLSGHVVERYQVPLPEAAARSKLAMTRRLEALCAAQVPGDTYRSLRIFPEWSDETYRHVLVPVWLLAYRYRGRAFQVVANGATGKMAGNCPRSPWKVLLLALAALAAAALVAWITGDVHLPFQNR